MRVTESRVSDEYTLLARRPLGKPLGAQFQQQIARAFRYWSARIVSRRFGRLKGPGGFETLGMRVAIYNDIPQEIQELGRAIALRFERDPSSCRMIQFF